MDEKTLNKALNLEDLQFFLEYVIAPIKEAIADLEQDNSDNAGGGASSEQLEALEKRLDEAQQNLVALALGLSIQQGAEVEGMAGNIVVETFSGTSGYIIVSGSYDSDNNRIYA
jgi:hypothetical protein